MISHGLGGNDWNHYLLASRLVEAEFIVVAVRHPDDLLRAGRPEHAVLRPLELSVAIDAVLEDNRFGSLIDQDRIGAFGFSLRGIHRARVGWSTRGQQPGCCSLRSDA